MRRCSILLILLVFTFFFNTLCVLYALENNRPQETAYDVLVSGRVTEVRGPLFFLLYQRFISEHNGAKCLFYPTCSDFFRRSAVIYGFVPAVLMTVDRIFYRENESSMRFYHYLRDKDLHLDPVYHNFIFNTDAYYLGKGWNP